MTQLDNKFKKLEHLINIGKTDYMSMVILDAFKSQPKKTDKQIFTRGYGHLKIFLQHIIKEIDTLGIEIKNDHNDKLGIDTKNDSNLLSVKNQKTLQTCFEILVSLGILPTLIPGIGIKLSKRCTSVKLLPQIVMAEQPKYELLAMSTDFLHRSYDIPVFKNIIITYYLSDYLAALIQLSFAPLKKPGVYENFIMKEEVYRGITKDKKKYLQVYEYLVNNCYQPKLMKELLMLQSMTDPKPPVFVMKVLSKEMSKRLTAPGGLLSLIRCFIETPHMDTGTEWKKIDTICNIVSVVHLNMSENDYIENITSQLKQILILNNEAYLAVATSCVWSLFEKYNGNYMIINLANEVFKPFNYDSLISKCDLPGTIILAPQEVEQSIHILNAFTCMLKIDISEDFHVSNLYVLFLLRMKSNKDITKFKITNIILKGLEALDEDDITPVVEEFIFGKENTKQLDLLIEEYDAGLAIKCCGSHVNHPSAAVISNILEIFKLTSNCTLVRYLFKSCLKIFNFLTDKRQKSTDSDTLLNSEREKEIINSNDERYILIIHILAEISASEKVVNALEEDPLIVIDFVENLLLKDIGDSTDECNTIALVLLNTILSNTSKTKDTEQRLQKLVPVLQKLSSNHNEYISILCNETLSLILLEHPEAKESEYEMALSNVYDKHLPVRAHGIMELTKLIDKTDPETLSKRHYVFCLFQKQLKDSDSYVYLSAINGIASLATHCTSEVLSVLCKEYLESSGDNSIETIEKQNKVAELRMKIGDIIVKVTKRLGEMAVVHKTILLNTMLCACRDDDPFIRASALSNIAEIAFVLNYKVGTIIYEILLCVCSIIETDKAIECRRAAVMVIANLIKGLGKDVLVELKENLLPIYKTLNKLYKDANEDSVVKLHAQIALEELNDIVEQYIIRELPMEKKISMINNSNDIVFK